MYITLFSSDTFLTDCKEKIMKFSDLGLSEKTLKAVADIGYTEATPIQEKAIPEILKRNDVIGIAQTGTGKTAAFTLPMIDLLANGRAKALMPRTLILSPTRELATQIAECFQQYGKYQKLSMALLIGGESMVEQQKILSRGVDVLIATPGRMIDLCERGRILLRDVQVFVLDEADRMLDMGFIPDIEKIAAKLPAMRQTLLFSATMPPEIKALAKKFMKFPVDVRVDPPASPAVTVTQYIVKCRKDDKRPVLRALVRSENVHNAMIFCNRKTDVDILFKSFTKHGFSVAALHGDMAQGQRTDTLNAFRDGQVQLLVCSDVAARGLDLPDVSHVFNFDVPFNSEDYIHRIGRTGRAGKSGRAFMLITSADFKSLAQIEKMIGRKIEELPDFSPESSPVLSEELEKAERKAARRRRRGGRGRGEKHGEKRREHAEAKPVKQENAQPKKQEKRPAKQEAKAPAKQNAKPAKPQTERKKPHPVFGNQLPAFMMNEVKL